MIQNEFQTRHHARSDARFADPYQIVLLSSLKKQHWNAKSYNVQCSVGLILDPNLLHLHAIRIHQSFGARHEQQ